MLTIILLIILAAVLLVIYANMNKGMMYGNGNTVEGFWYYPNDVVGPGNVVRSAPFYYYPYRQYYQNLFPYVYYW